MRIVAFLSSVVLAAIGGVMAYRALLLEPNAAVIVTETSVREVPDVLPIGGGMILLVVGASLAFIVARRKRM